MTDTDDALLARRRREFEDAWTLKQDERREQREARRYYHGSPWTKSQLEELRKRKQPPTVTPAYARKINGFVGLMERLRQDPKAYPRTPKEDQGAELCTAVIRYALDEQDWQAKSLQVSLNAAVDGIAGVEIGLVPGDSGIPGDFDISVAVVEPDYFFYDPRSFKHDFSDARFMGVSKWVDIEDAKLMFPGKEAEIESAGDGSQYDISEDRDLKWANIASGGRLTQVRIVEHWYKRGEQWWYAFYTGNIVLDQGRSYLSDEKGRDICRFVMWCSFIDQDGDRYSFHRYMKTLTDEINQRGSKALHLLSQRRMKIKGTAPGDEIIQYNRKEAIKPDGVMVVPPNMDIEFEDAKTLADMQGQLAMRQASQQELENFGPNPALVGQDGVSNRSGRAIALMQQAGLAELGPFMGARRGWNLRVYRTIWNAIRRHWVAQRWIRVIDGDGQAQPVPINGQELDPITGTMQAVNQIGALDVDIIIDEGPDQVNMQADALEVLQSLAAQGQQIPPTVFIKLLPLWDSVKKELLAELDKASQPDPAAEQAKQIELAQGAAKVQETQASAAYKMAQARSVMQPEPGQMPDMPTDAETMETMASAEEKRASAFLKLTQAQKTRVETELAPMQAANAVMAKVQRVTQLPAGS